MTHSELCELTAKRFVQKNTIAFWEVTTSLMEKPDVLVLNSSGVTEIFEIKISHSDFLADAKKEARKNPMFGDRRSYVCEWGLIQPEEVPNGWGLYWYKNGKFYQKKNSDYFKDIPKDKKYRYLCWVLINEMSCRKHNVVVTKRISYLDNNYDYKYIEEVEEEDEK